jgi:hypothetical protein
MDGGELARLPPDPAKAPDGLHARTLHDADLAVRAIDHVDKFLLGIRRERDLVDRAVHAGLLLEEMLGHEGAILAEDLQAIVGAVADVDQAILGDANAVHRIAELLRGRLRGVVGRLLLVVRRLSVAGLELKHNKGGVSIVASSGTGVPDSQAPTYVGLYHILIRSFGIDGTQKRLNDDGLGLRNGGRGIDEHSLRSDRLLKGERDIGRAIGTGDNDGHKENSRF